MVDGADARAVTELDASHARPTSSTSMQAGAGVRMTTLVSGVGGITGDTVLSVLAQRGVPVRALVHRDERRSAAFRLGADSVVVADYDDEAALATAIAGVDAVFFVAPRSPTLTNSSINPCCTRSLLRCPTTCGGAVRGSSPGGRVSDGRPCNRPCTDKQSSACASGPARGKSTCPTTRTRALL